jgi:glutamate dehydrogenase (NADP+)
MSDIIEFVKNRDPNQKEFIQAVTEVMESVKPVLNRCWTRIHCIAN